MKIKFLWHFSKKKHHVNYRKTTLVTTPRVKNWIATLQITSVKSKMLHANTGKKVCRIHHTLQISSKNHSDISNITLKYPNKSKQRYNRIRNTCSNQQMFFTFAQR